MTLLSTWPHLWELLAETNTSHCKLNQAAKRLVDVVAIETADLALMGQDLRHLPQALHHVRRTRQIMLQNVGLSLTIITVLMPLAVFRTLGLAAVVLIHELAEVVVIANGVRPGQAQAQPRGLTEYRTVDLENSLTRCRNPPINAVQIPYRVGTVVLGPLLVGSVSPRDVGYGFQNSADRWLLVIGRPASRGDSTAD